MEITIMSTENLYNDTPVYTIDQVRQMIKNQHDRFILWEETKAKSWGNGWVPFGWHANYAPCPELEFSDTLDEGGLPMFERAKGAFVDE